MFAFSTAKLLAAALLSVLVATTSGQAFRLLSEGQPAPAFTAKDMTGTDVSLSTYAGKVVVVVFFKPDQKNSQGALADLKKINDKYASKGVAIIAITPEVEQQNKIRELMDNDKINYPVLLDEGRKAYGAWGTFLFPTTGILGKDGNLFHEVPSYNFKYADEVEAYVRLALGEINKEHVEELLNPKGHTVQTTEQKDAVRRMMLGQQMVERKRLDKAAEEYAKAVELDPNLAEAHARYGFVLLKLNDPAKAVEHFKKALEIDPKADDAKTGLGSAMVAQGEVDKGIEFLEDAIKTNPKPARAHYELGLAYEKKGMLDKASANYRKAAEELGGVIW